MHYVGLQSVEDQWSEGLLILMYHSVAVPPLGHSHRGLHVAPRHLARQLHELQANTASSFTTLGEWSRTLPAGRRVVLTFDDAYCNLFTNGLPVLQQAGVRAITYVVASLIGKTNEWDAGTGARCERLMERAQLTEWVLAGNEIGSHGLSHRALTSLSREEARREIIDSKKMLEDLFGQAIRHFCYPYGDWSPAIRDMVEEAGYETATTTDAGINEASADQFGLRRFLARHHRPWLAALHLE